MGRVLPQYCHEYKQRTQQLLLLRIIIVNIAHRFFFLAITAYRTASPLMWILCTERMCTLKESPLWNDRIHLQRGVAPKYRAAPADFT